MDSREKMNELVKRYTEEYMAKVFYFCLKKTGNSSEAEDLAADISLNIITALHKGTIPVNFSAWVWQIARNAYSGWVGRKHRDFGPAEADISEYEIADERESIEQEKIHDEELTLLRRELSFIASDYRDILVAYYMEERKTHEIAAALNLPKGTVVSKLFRARNILKEGMEMAREFGTKSYKPENIYFRASGNITSGLPWSAVRRMMPKNILLEASNNPSTAEELAMSLGTALPYMEEEIELLCEATLLKKIGNKYITNFLILSQECRLQIYHLLRGNSEERSALLDRIVSDTLGEIRGLGIVRNGMDDNGLKWWAMIYAVDFFLSCLEGWSNIGDPAKRENGEAWGFIGYEDGQLPEECGMGLTAFTDAKQWVAFRSYQIKDYNMYRRAGMINGNTAGFLGEVIRKKRKVSSFTDFERDRWREIENRFVHMEEDGSVTPDILVMEGNELEEIGKIWRRHPLYDDAVESLQEAFEKIVKLLREENNPAAGLEEQLAYYASMEMLAVRMMTVRSEVNSGRLAVPEDPENSTVAMWLEIWR